MRWRLVGDEVGKVCWSQVLEGLTYFVAVPQVRAESSSCRGDVWG